MALPSRTEAIGRHDRKREGHEDPPLRRLAGAADASSNVERRPESCMRR